MIEMIGRNGPPEAMICPALICDVCREQVADSGNVVYYVRYVEGERESSPLFVSHKPHDRELRAVMEEAYPLADGWTSQWDEAKYFMEHLVHNFTHPFADDADGEYLSHRLVLPH